MEELRIQCDSCKRRFSYKRIGNSILRSFCDSCKLDRLRKQKQSYKKRRRLERERKKKLAPQEPTFIPIRRRDIDPSKEDSAVAFLNAPSKVSPVLLDEVLTLMQRYA